MAISNKEHTKLLLCYVILYCVWMSLFGGEMGRGVRDDRGSISEPPLPIWNQPAPIRIYSIPDQLFEGVTGGAQGDARTPSSVWGTVPEFDRTATV